MLFSELLCEFSKEMTFILLCISIAWSVLTKAANSCILSRELAEHVFLTALSLQAKEEKELPEYILGTVRLNRVNPDSAVSI